MEVDRGGVAYSPGGGFSPGGGRGYRSRSTEHRSTKASRTHSSDARYLGQAHAPNLDSIKGGKDGPAPILTLHKNWDYRGHPTDVKDQVSP